MKKEEEKSINPQSVNDFLKDNVEEANETKEIHFDRFKSPFVVKALSAKEMEQLRANNTSKKRNRSTGQTSNQLDTERFGNDMLVKSVISPNLNSVELQGSYGTTGSAIKTLVAMLTSKEYSTLNLIVNDLSGDGSGEALNDLADQAKK